MLSFMLASWVATATLAIYALLLHRQLHQHRHDPLTGLPTRATFYRQARRRLRRDPLATVALLDLNNFKPINDRHGHAAGDYVLAVTADRLRHHFRHKDALVCRLGGDEFAVVYSQHPHLVHANLLTLTTAMSQPVQLPPSLDHGARVEVGASIGAVHLGDIAHPSLSAALHHADGLMYRAKRSRTSPNTPRPPVATEQPPTLRPRTTRQPVARQRLHGPCRSRLRTLAHHVTTRT